MATENIAVTLGVDYLIEINIDRFPELLEPDFILTGQVRVLSTNLLTCSFDITKSPSKNRIYLILKSINTKNLVINKQHKYVYDIIATSSTRGVFKLVDGTVSFKKPVTAI